MQTGSQTSQRGLTGKGVCPPVVADPLAVDTSLGINAKFAPTFSRPSSEKPHQSRISGRCVSSAKAHEKPDEDKKAASKKARRYRRFLAMEQRRAIYDEGLAAEFSTLCACSAFPVPEWSKRKDGSLTRTGAPGAVQLTWRGGDGSEEAGAQLVHSWVKRCASPLLCYVCAPKIRWARSQEVKAVCKCLYSAGYCWLFLTFTAPHDLTSDPVLQVKLFQEAMRIFKRNFDRFKDRWGLRFEIRAVEMTDDAPGRGYKSGCHFHHHVVCFFERKEFTGAEVAEIRAFLSRRWVDALVKVGICGEDKRAAALRWAFRLDVPRRPQHLNEEDLDAVAEYLAKGASLEMAPGVGVKKGRGAGRITHWRLMELAFTKNPELRPRALAIMRALKGRSWLQFSRGLKVFCGLDEKSDEEILKEDLSAFLYEYENSQWRKLDEVKGQVALQESIIEIARDTGIDLTSLPRDPDPEKKGRLDLEHLAVRKIQEIAQFSIEMIADWGRDPLTAAWLWDDLRAELGIVEDDVGGG